MTVADIHTEEYEVKSDVEVLTGPPRLRFDVKEKDASGDSPVREFYLQQYLSGDTRTGREWLEDTTAKVRLVDDLTRHDYADATTQIHKGSIVSYVSTRLNNFENISCFTWS